MLKSLFFLLSLVFTMVAAASTGTDCAIKAESYVVDAGITKPARYVGKTREGELIFYVRANLHGGDSEYEVVLENTKSCDFRSIRLIWAE